MSGGFDPSVSNATNPEAGSISSQYDSVSELRGALNLFSFQFPTNTVDT